MILLIDNYDSFTFNLYQMLSQYETVEVIRNDGKTLEEIEAMNPAGIVLSPWNWADRKIPAFAPR